LQLFLKSAIVASVVKKSQQINPRRFAMKCIVGRITLLASALMMFAVPVLADEAAMDRLIEQQRGKDECLLVAMNCKDQVDSIQQRIDKIKKEIGRGTSVYTNEELKKLNRELDEATRNLEEINTGA
jgi:peptidoglycan hydrolase CwlO-like protein